MRTHFIPMVRALAVPAAVSLAFQVMAIAPAMAQDPVKVDAKHYKVEFENEQVRVLRITYGPHEKSVMHAHPANVAVFLTDGTTKFTLPDGKTIPGDVKAGMVRWDGGGKHLPENVGDKPFELILVELKGKHAAAKAK
jgi:quercetin dioxygenase-like cupin family protein